jgi:thymidylate kinase
MSRRPVILIEGLDGVGKSTLSRRLADQLGAVRLSSPPELGAHEVLGPLRGHFDTRPTAVRRAFYRFANLIVSEAAEVSRADRPVVIDRYWPSTVAFGVGVDNAVDLEAWVGRYPPELIVPDVMIVLEVDERARAARMTKRGEAMTQEEDVLASGLAKRAAVSQVYRAFAPIVIDTSPHDEDGVLRRVLEELRRTGI